MLSPQYNPIDTPVLNQDRQLKAREYSKKHRILSLLEMGISLVLLLILIFSGFSKLFISLFPLAPLLKATLYCVVLVLAFGILTSPLNYYAGFVLPHRYGLSIQNLKSWLTDLVKSGILSLVLGSAAVAVIFWLLAAFPGVWWLIAWGLMIGVSLIMTIIAPVFLVPLFFKVKPLDQGELRSRLEQLAAKSGARIQGVFTLDFSTKSTVANAGLMGLGKTRRIVISDTLIKEYSLPEIEVITAHEIGHNQHRDIFRLFVIQSVVFLIVIKIAKRLIREGVS